jgi:hypothetical protein
MQPSTLGEYTIGADPEAFLRKKGQLVAVQPYVEGTKDKPQPLPMGGNAQRDNVAIEFGIMPAKTKVEFVQNIGDTLHDLLDLLPADVDIDIIPSANFPEQELTHKECKEFGCDPDLNAWTMQKNEAPKDAADSPFRSCGGHIHVGFVAGSGNTFLNDIDGKAMLIRMMDCFHGLVSTVLDNGPDAIARRELYGKAGCCRWTDYGVEYRTLSNYWIKRPALVELMHSLTTDAIEVMRKDGYMDIIMELGPDNVQNVITTGDAEMAFDMVTGFMIDYMSEESQNLFWDAYAISHEDNEPSYKTEWEEYK